MQHNVCMYLPFRPIGTLACFYHHTFQDSKFALFALLYILMSIGAKLIIHDKSQGSNLLDGFCVMVATLIFIVVYREIKSLVDSESFINSFRV